MFQYNRRQCELQYYVIEDQSEKIIANEMRFFIYEIERAVYYGDQIQHCIRPLTPVHSSLKALKIILE